MTTVAPKFGVGASALRKEDLPLLKGEGAYTSDIARPDELRGFVLRSPYAAAAFRIVSTEAAEQAPGVHLVWTAKDVADLGDVPCLQTVTQPDGTAHEVRDTPVLCRDRVRHVGDAVAFIVADSQGAAEDAAELIEIDWEMEDANVSLAAAGDEGVPLVWPELGSNLVYRHQTGDAAAVEKAFAAAERDHRRQQSPRLELSGDPCSSRRMGSGERGIHAHLRVAGRSWRARFAREPRLPGRPGEDPGGHA
jgi:carbon-monoxide dehydrogenase large subunit